MNEIPAKVVMAESAVIGVFLGMGIIVFHSIKIIAIATKNHKWNGFRSL
jgi:hypothetical protein